MLGLVVVRLGIPPATAGADRLVLVHLAVTDLRDGLVRDRRPLFTLHAPIVTVGRAGTGLESRCVIVRPQALTVSTSCAVKWYVHEGLCVSYRAGPLDRLDGSDLSGR